MLTFNSPKLAAKFICEICDYKCRKESDFNKHLNTRKHSDTYKYLHNEEEKAPKLYMCTNCNKKYTFRQSLYNHKKKCNTDIKQDNIVLSIVENDNHLINIILKENNDFKNLVLEVVKNNSELLKQNQQLQEQMIEVCKNSNININSNNNSNNKTFNLQFFLNEQCKDAMNIMDFVNTFQLQFSDLERIGEVGYVEGISSLIIDKLNQMDIYKRPIHCSDAKRETMHIKDNDVWEKDNATNDKLRLAIRHITKKNSDMVRPWADKHPGVLYSDHRLNDKYQEIIMEAMGGKNNKTMQEGEAKIIKKISKMVLINKNI